MIVTAIKINVGDYIETAIDWLTNHFAVFFDVISKIIGGVISGMENAFLFLPFWVVILILAALAWWKAGKGISIFTAIGLLFIYFMGYWTETMQTLALVLASTVLALVAGIPLGIWAAKNKTADKIIRPILDFMQTMPAFVYLIPAVLFFGLGKVPGAFATVIFAMPPAVRLTRLGIIQVPGDIVEASKAFGATQRQLLYKVQLPLATPTILAGVNQTIMKMFTAAEDDIRKDLPNFNVATLMGSNIDIFHKDPSHQRGMLAGLTSTYEANLKIGGRSMQVIANPVINADGRRIGTVAEWSDRTAEVAIEEEMTELVTDAQSGVLSTRLSTEGKEGFFKQLSENLNNMLDVLEATFTDISNVMSTLRDGDLTNTIDRAYEGIFSEVKDNVNGTIEQIKSIVNEIRESSGQIDSTASEIASGNHNLSTRTEQQAAALEEVASSMEQITSTVKQNADNAAYANTLASNAGGTADEGGRVVEQAVNAMTEINASSSKIAEIIGVIDEIAFQTNLLALNASVEAARAGEQGRGFAVVATEVRNLAQRSATAAKEIKDLINDSVKKVHAGSELVNESGIKLEEIVTGVKKVKDIVAEIAAASSEQATGVDQVSTAITSMDDLTQQNAALAEQASAASTNMSEQAQGMNKQMQFFDTGN